jgi:O-antigen ligase
MALLILLGSGFFLASVATLDQRLLQLVLLFIFLCAGLLIHYRALTAYFAFVFLYPLLPSQWQSVSSFDFLEFSFLCLAFWWAAQRIRKKNLRLPDHPLTPFLFLFLLVSGISVFLALLRNNFLLSEIFFLKLKDHWNIFLSRPSSDVASFRNFLYLTEGMLFFYITTDLLDSSGKIRKTAKIIFYSAAIVSILGIIQYAFRFHLLDFWIKENPEIVRINSTFSDPNSLGTYLATLFSFATFAYFSSFSKQNIRHFLLLGVISLALIFTASRAGLGAAFLVLFLLPPACKWFRIDVTGRPRGPTVWLAKYGAHVAICVVAGLVLLALIINYQNPTPGSLFQVALFTFNPQLTLDEVLKGRITFWKTALEVFSNYPIFGCGPGELVNALHYRPYFATQPENAHNNFLQILAETGTVGFLFFFVILVQGARLAIRKLRSADIGDFPLLFGLFGGWIAFLLTCLTGHPLLLLKLQLLFWIFLGILSTHKKESDLFRNRFIFIVLTAAILLLGAFQIRSVLHSRSISNYEYGYHIWEKDEQGNLFRWTQDAAISELEVRGEVLTLYLRQLNPEFLKKPSYVKLFLNDKLLDTLHFSDSNWREVKYFIPPFVNGSYATLRIEPESSFVPHVGPDKRELGIAVRNFVWECPLPYPLGVYELERAEEESFYWTRGQASFPLHLSDASMTLRLLANRSSKQTPTEVEFYWGDVLLKRASVSGEQWEQISLNVPPGKPDGILTLRVSRTTNPRRGGNSMDVRDLGVRLVWPPSHPNGKWATMQTETTGTLKDPTIYGISNNTNQPVRLLSYSIEPVPAKLQVFRSGVLLEPASQLIDSISGRDEKWTRVFPKSGPTEEFFVSNKITEELRVPHGRIVIRMTAMGIFAAGQVPVVSLKIDQREVARQPILFKDWTDYYFSVLYPPDGRTLSVEFVNDYYGQASYLDRNLLIKEIVVVPAKQYHPHLNASWQMLQKSILVAEPLDPDAPFSPQNYCYSIASKK